MSHLGGDERIRYVRRMFGRIAQRYDILNRLMTFGVDIHLRRIAARRLAVSPKAVVLDNGSGTGDLAAEIIRQQSDCPVIACDLTPEMVQIGKQRHARAGIQWVIADAQALPLANNTCSRAVCGYLLRNVPDPDRAIGEMKRVLESGGRLVSLDTTPPRQNWMRPFVMFYIKRVIPLMGRFIAGDSEAYTYLPDSTVSFRSAEELAHSMEKAGFSRVSFSRHLFGCMALHQGDKL